METKISSRRHFLRDVGSFGALFIASPLWSGYQSKMQRSNPNTDTWVLLDDKVYGAKSNAIGPLGGGVGYQRLLTDGIVVRDLDALIHAMEGAAPGDVIFIPGDVIIDFTTYIYIDDFVLNIPAGVTLASDRGYNGSSGALLTSDSLKTDGMIRAQGEGVRISGLRLQGPNGKRYLEHHTKSFGPGGDRHAYYYKFPVSSGIETEYASLQVDNCEVSAFSRAGISLKGGMDHHIHHCSIHHCQYNGLGYGVSHDQSTSIIECNLFDSNRHSIAGTGRQGSGYIARHNVELGTSLSHCFDMHGGKDRKDGTQIAGKSIQIHNNTFRAPESSVGIRGEPEESCDIFGNWFVRHQEIEEAVKGHLWAHVKVYDNAFGVTPMEAR